MSGETPDWGRANAQAAVFPVTDLGELAARLGSPATFDRRGDVAYIDDFESGLHNWSQTLSGTGALADLTTLRSRSGRLAARLVGGSSSSRLARINRSLPRPGGRGLGCEFSFALPSAVDNVRVTLSVYEAATATHYAIVYDDVNNKLSYLNFSAGLTDFATGVSLATGATLFHTLKIVIDRTLELYARAILDDVEYELTSALPNPAIVSDGPKVVVGFQVVSRSGQNDACYADDCVFTTNEHYLPAGETE